MNYSTATCAAHGASKPDGQLDGYYGTCEKVPCPANSVNEGHSCKCIAGYTGDFIGADGVCTPVDCPANTYGDNVLEGCTCNAGYRDTKDSGASYLKITSGTCADVGMAPITEQNECNTAAAAIGNTDTSSTVTFDSPRPEGCYDNGNLWLATNAANIGRGALTHHQL